MNPTIIINIFTSIVVFIVGFLFVTSLVAPNMNFYSRIIFGIILMSYGIFRFLNVQTKLKIQKQNEQSEKIEKAKEELIKKSKYNEKDN